MRRWGRRERNQSTSLAHGVKASTRDSLSSARPLAYYISHANGCEITLSYAENIPIGRQGAEGPRTRKASRSALHGRERGVGGTCDCNSRRLARPARQEGKRNSANRRGGSGIVNLKQEATIRKRKGRCGGREACATALDEAGRTALGRDWRRGGPSGETVSGAQRDGGKGRAYR